MADWQGQLAVSAVPGAGKSTGMAVAAAFAIAFLQFYQSEIASVAQFAPPQTSSQQGLGFRSASATQLSIKPV